jgi:hypothetical protein
LVCWKYAKGAKPKRGTFVEPAPAAHDVPYNAIARDGHGRQTGEHVAVVAQRTHQSDLRRLAALAPGGRSGMNRGDPRLVSGGLSAHQHGPNLGRAAPGNPVAAGLVPTNSTSHRAVRVASEPKYVGGPLTQS